jgi:hypothetical protein
MLNSYFLTCLADVSPYRCGSQKAYVSQLGGEVVLGQSFSNCVPKLYHFYVFSRQRHLLPPRDRNNDRIALVSYQR